MAVDDLLLVENQEQIGQLTSCSHAASQISNPLLAQNQNQVEGTHLLFPCRISNQQSIACTKPESGWENSRPIRTPHPQVRSAIHCLHKTRIRLGELTPYSHAASWISNPLLAQNQNQVGVTDNLFARRISDHQSIACTKPESGWGNSLPIRTPHLRSAIHWLHKTRILHKTRTLHKTRIRLR